MLDFVISAFKFIFLIGFLVLIHEGGHFMVAKLFRVKVNEFSIGFGKKIIGKQKGETLYALRAIPLGGYVMLEGEETESNDPRAFNNKSVWKRILIVLARWGSKYYFWTHCLFYYSNWYWKLLFDDCI